MKSFMKKRVVNPGKGMVLMVFIFTLALPSADAETVIGDFYVSGRLGVGIDGPVDSLDVQGEVARLRLGNIRLWAGGENQNIFQLWDDISGYEIARLQRVYGVSRLGIGTPSPKTTLHIYSLSPGIIIEPQPQASGGDGGYLLFQNVGAATGAALSYSFTNSRIGLNTAEGQFLLVAKTDTGRVGIGTTEPEALLHVAGDTLVDGTLSVEYQDIAEWVTSSEKLEPGMVVAVDPRADNQVVASVEEYCTRVAGVVSRQPGLLQGEKGENKCPITHSGRVITKITASNGQIKRGDLLVASSIAGTAMRSEAFECGNRTIHQPGTILGKALEDWPEGEGEILVLISLQ